uniref:ATP synthase F0 subunit 6 n=1 Tax=Glyphohesione klatti TaxID=3053539 RepID=UPI0030E3A0CC
MMMDIFSSFDPHIYSISSSVPSILFWILSTASIFILHTTFWVQPNRVFWMISIFTNVIFAQSMRTSTIKSKGFTNFITSLFLLLTITNLSGLIPYMFSSSSHLFFTFTLGLPLWLSIVLSSFTYSPISWMAHLLPSGAPWWLNPFLILIETMSIILRPITLSFRLTANMSAGHIVLSLLGSFASSLIFTAPTTFILLMITQILYMTFEIGICLIQAYIFCLLLTLYMDEHTN